MKTQILGYEGREVTIIVLATMIAYGLFPSIIFSMIFGVLVASLIKRG